jgi:hypothetical protein
MPYYKTEPQKLTKVMLHGLTKTSVEGLVPIAKSWLNPPELKLLSNKEFIKYEGHDLSEKAYVFSIIHNEYLREIKFNISADQENPAINPVFIINNRNQAAQQIKLNGFVLEKGKEYTTGIEKDLETSNLVIWINKELTGQSTFVIQ